MKLFFLWREKDMGGRLVPTVRVGLRLL